MLSKEVLGDIENGLERSIGTMAIGPIQLQKVLHLKRWADF